jgi:F-type H+-transporting ATPase subunit b|tara:strand:+ start:424 stop:909 length:486 start_codon:yes stop_codon:yes gene_type:complete
MTISPEISVAIAFVIFVVLVLWKGTRKITEGLDKRAERIRNQLNETQNLREEAQAALASYQRHQRDALAEAEQIIAQAEAEAERLKEHAEEVLAATIKRREEQAVQRIAQAEASAVQDVRDQAVELAIGVATKLIAEKIDKSVQGSLIETATNDVIKSLRN